MRILANNIVVSKFKTIVGADQSNNAFYLFCFLLILGFTAFLIQFNNHDDETPSQSPVPSPTLDSYVPKGMILIPVELSNYESLDQLIGNYGVVDLLTIPLSPLQNPKTIVKKVKILKSGHQPPKFHVLVKENESLKITKQSGELMALVRNPDSLGTKFVNRKAKERSRQIFYDMEIK